MARAARPTGGILLIGATGMLGSALAGRLREIARDFRAVSRRELDLERPESIRAFLAKADPETVINTAAFTDVNRAELAEHRREVFRVNRDGPGDLARACAAGAVRLVHVSTDYVFDGLKGAPYVEDDPTAPVQVYGTSKLEGERAVLAAWPEALVVRTSTLYGPGRSARPAYVDAIRAQALTRTVLEVVEPPIASPTLSHDLARGILSLVDAGASGVVHVVNRGSCSRLELARAVVALSGLSGRVEVVPRPASPSGPARPPFSALGTDRFAAVTGGHLRGWRDALAEYLSRG